MIDLRAPDITVTPLRQFRVGSNAGGGHGVRLSVDTVSGGKVKTITETVYRYVTRSVGGRPRDTREETDRWRELVAAGIV